MDKKGGITPQYLSIYKRMQKYRQERNGKPTYDLKAAEKRDPKIKSFCETRDLGRIEFARLLHRIGKLVKKNYLKIKEPADHKEGFVRTLDFFGNIGSYNRLCDEIRSLVQANEPVEQHGKRLQRKYHLYPGRTTKPTGRIKQKDRNILIKELWDSIESEEREFAGEGGS